MKPIKWVGTQRSVYTHRKKQKRIKQILSNISGKIKKAAPQPKADIKAEEHKTKAEPDEEMFEDCGTDSSESVTVFVAKAASLLNNGLG